LELSKPVLLFQKLRGRKDKLIIYKEDIRYKEKERKISHLVVFVVDGLVLWQLKKDDSY